MAGFAEQLTGTNGFLTQIKAIYDSDMTHGPDWEWEYYNRIVNKQDWEPNLLIAKVGILCNRAYVSHKGREAKAGRAVDPTALDWKTLPDCLAAGQWLEKAYGAWFQYQMMTHEIEPGTGGWEPNPWDHFGMWNTASANHPHRHWFEGSGYFSPYARYTHLFGADFLKSSRPRIMASLCALRVGSSNTGTYDFEAPGAAGAGAQWLLKVNAWVQMTTALLRTEKLLGIGASATDCSGAGTFSSVDALSTTERLTANTKQHVDQVGHDEYNGSYGHVIIEQLLNMMAAPSSQRVYDDVAPVYRSMLWDISANFSPPTGTPTGPASRNFDLLMNSHNALENFVLPLFVQPFFHPYCDRLKTCLASTPAKPILPASAGPSLRWFDSFFAMWQLGGFGVFPYHDTLRLAVANPIRTNVQRAGLPAGKDRQNFVSPYYSLGNAGDEPELLADNYLLTARLGGAPNSGFPATPEPGGATDHTFAIADARHMLTSQDDPFVTTATDNRPGLGAQLTPRQITAQYQSWMLVTQLAVPGQSNSTSYGSFNLPLSSNLLLPLAVDELSAEDQPLPRTSGVAAALPPGVILTLRLGDAAIVIRTIVHETSAGSNLKPVDRVTPSTVVAPGSGAYQAAIQWQVDESSYKVGYGKVVFAHKVASDAANRPYHIAWLWAGGLARNAAELAALRTLVKDAPITSTFQTAGKWDYASNMFTGAYEGMTPVGSSTWTVEAKVAGHSLRVKRQDVYDPWSNDPMWLRWNSTFPYYSVFERTWDGTPTMPDDWSDTSAFVREHRAIQGSRAYLSIPYAAEEFYQPHIH